MTMSKVASLTHCNTSREAECATEDLILVTQGGLIRKFFV